MSLPLLSLKALQAQCDPGPWSRGQALVGDGSVQACSIEPGPPGQWCIHGKVRGTEPEPYEVTATLVFDAQSALMQWRGVCTCPVGTDCKHAVAITLCALQHHPAADALPYHPAGAPHTTAHSTKEPDASPSGAEILIRQQAAALAEADAHMAQWLHNWDTATATPRAAVSEEPRSPSTQREQPIFLASIVSPSTAQWRSPHAPLVRLRLEAVVSRPKAGGGWIKPKPLRNPPAPGQALFDHATDAEREVLQLLAGMGDTEGMYYAAREALPRAVLQGSLGVQVLQLAASTGFLFAQEGDFGVGKVLQWGDALPVTWVWSAVAPGKSSGFFSSGEDQWALQAHLPQASAQLCVNDPPLYLDTVRGLCGLVQVDGLTAAQISMLLQAPALSALALQRHQAALASRLAGKLPLPPVMQARQPMQRLARVKPVARLHFAPASAQDVPFVGLLTARLQFDYRGPDQEADAQWMGWWEGQPLEVLLTGANASQRRLQRDADSERTAIRRLMDLGLLATNEGLFGIPGQASQNNWMHWADNGFAVFSDAGFEVSLDAALEGWIAHADALDVALQPPPETGGVGAGALDSDTTSAPWFALSLGVEIGGVRHNILPLLPTLIAAVAQQPADPNSLPNLPPYAYLPAQGRAGFIRLPTEALRPWMAALLELVGDSVHDFSSDTVRLSRMEALRTGAALSHAGAGTEWEGADALRSLQALVVQLQGAQALPVVPVPAGVHATLRPYQQQGLNWLQFLRAHGLAGVLADDMGLGKTLQTLAHIQVEKDAGRLTAPALIIAPVSLMGNWAREAAQFCPGLRCQVLHGAARHEAAGVLADCDIVIAPYSLLHRDRDLWLARTWHLAVLDEAQNIKNASTHAARVVGQLQARHRLCLSGTPMENHLGEVWSLFHFLMPGFLGSPQRFKEIFRHPIEKLGDTARMAQLRARITPFMLRRTKALVATELPPKVESVMAVELSGAQADLYEAIRLGTEKTVREALQAKGLAKSQVTILDALLKLRQVCCDPRLVPLGAASTVTTSAKLEQLMLFLPEMLAEGRRVLLFSQFTSMLALIEAELQKRGVPWVKLTGQSQRRDALIEQFTSGQVPLFLISLKAGGVGLNLPQADTVIHYDPWWNPAVENQATDRAHRIGQTQSVWVIKLVAQGTIEERILTLQERKAQLAQSLYIGSIGRKEPIFSEDDLMQLLQPLSSMGIN
ncbi:MAG: DEAD/DEAH box helicase [Burkholderiaceae bacterium]|nr:DEAD/DEAH box helicase [Burkholderiaceae bacterium]